MDIAGGKEIRIESMRRILITQQIEDLAKLYAKRLEYGGDFAKGNAPKDKLKMLASVLGKSSTKISVLKNKATKGHPATYTKYKGDSFLIISKYVQTILDKYDGLNNLLPSQYDSFIGSKLKSIIVGAEPSDIKVKIRKKRESTQSDLIVEAMGYSKVQSSIMPKYIRDLGIKTCVYCNAQFATTALLQTIKILKKSALIKNEAMACYELDHNKPKSKYPYLCTNFYNLQPSCSSCNRRKGDRELQFSLYYEDIQDDSSRPVHFALNGEDLIRFRATNKCDGIKVFLCNNSKDVSPPLADTTSIAGELNTKLGIQSVYDEHSDVVEEILWKHKIYSSGLVSALSSQLPSLGIAGFDVKRFILGGYYTRENDFLKRPLSVLKEDLWEQLERK